MIALRKKIMVVDDNVIDQMITQHVLKKTYIQSDILIMDSPLQALNYLEANEKSISCLPSLIILDLDMPEINGFGFLERFSHFADKLKDAIKIVVLTASDIAEDIELLNANPTVSKLISKPLYSDSLVEVF